MTTTHLWEVDAIDGPSWSVSVEFTLNLVFPLFVLLCIRSSRGRAVALAALCGAALVLVSVLNHRLDGGVAGELGTLDTRLMYLRCGPEFGLGMLCWRLWRQAPRAAVFGGTAWLAAVLAGMLVMAPFKAMDLPFVAACCLLVIGLAPERSRIAAVLGSPVPHWLGTISFSLYLWHAAFLPLRPALLRMLPADDPGVALMVANTMNLGLVLAVATLSYHGFEVPVRRWLRGRFAVSV
jgi:peptidoglycan/LPS O-acetylase OafA/YrhL